MTGPKHPRVERLALNYFSQMILKQDLPRDEATVTVGLNPAWDPRGDREENWRLTTALLRTAQAFVLAVEDFYGLTRSLAEEGGWKVGDGKDFLYLDLGKYDVTEDEMARELRMSMVGFDRPSTLRLQPHPIEQIAAPLPPLPFPRIAIEVWNPETDAPEGIYADASSVMPLVLISEREQGEVWDVMCPTSVVMHPDPNLRSTRFAEEFYRETALGEPGLFSFEIRRRETPLPPYEFGKSAEEDAFIRGVDDAYAWVYWRRMIFDLVDMVTIENAEREPVALPRGHRRNFERRHGVAHPAVYFINLRNAGEDRGGVTDREYHCRWIVRGHWRHFRDGRRSWIRPYVKGPRGMPFRGKPVYTTVGGEDE